MSPATAAALPPAWTRGSPAPGARAVLVDLAAVDTTPSQDRPERWTVSGNVAALLVSPRLHADVMALRGLDGEHRLATVVFAAVMGTDESVSRLGAGFADGVEDLIRAAQANAERYRVHFLYTDVTADGLKLLVVAGAPVSTGDDEEAGLRFAADWVHGDPLRKLRAGVHRGRIFAGFLGSPDRQAYTVMGDPVNLAARLMTRARPGQVVASEEVVAHSGAVFASEAVPPFLVKGKTDPISAFVVGLPTGERRTAATRALPLVGREAEVAQLRAAIGAAADGRGHVVEIVGDAGIGKTRLLQAVQDDPRLAVRILTECQPYDGLSPFAGVRPLLRRSLGVEVAAAPAEAGRQLATVVERVAPDVAPMLPLVAMALGAEVADTPEAAAVAEEFRVARMHEAVLRLLEAALPTPSLLVVEDVYYVDDASLQLLRAIAARASARPWVLLITRRPEGAGLVVGEVGGTLLKLEPLTGDSVGRLAELAVTDRAIVAPALAAMVERSGGNPLFVLELIDAAGAGVSAEDLPESIERLVATRVDRLPAADRALLRQAAVVGRVFHVDVLDRLLEADGSPPAGDEPWRRLTDFVEPEGGRRWRFRHALFRDVAYEGLPFARRKRMHRSVGELLEAHVAGTPDPALLSLHFWLAGDADRTWRYSVAAGEAAWRSLAVTEAIAAYARALSVRRRLRARTPGEVIAVAEALGDALERTGRYDDAREAYGVARRTASAERPHHRARLMRKVGVLSERQGQYGSAIRWWSRGMRLVADEDDPASVREQAELCLAIGGVRHRQGRHGEMLSWARQARALATVVGDLRLQAYALDHEQVAVSHGVGDPTTEPGEHALRLFEELDDVLHQGKVLNNLGVEAQFRGRWDEAADRYLLAREHFTRAGDVAEAATAANNLGEVRCDQGRLDDAVRLLEAAHRDWQACGFKLGAALSEANLGRALVRGGRHDDGMARLASAVDAFEAMGARAFVAEGRVRVAEAHVAAGRPEVALAVLDELVAEGLPTTGSTARRVEGWARVQLGDRVGAAAAFAGAVEAAEGTGAGFELAWSLEGLAAVADDAAEAVRARARSARLQRDLGVVSLPAVPTGA